MSARVNYFKIGLFAISAAIIVTLAVIILGAGTVFRKKYYFETYIKESVQGLDTGSRVRFRGVHVGNVEEITLVGKEYNTNRRYVLVRSSIFPNVFRAPTETVATRGLDREIENGLRVRMASRGITGTAYLEADYLDPKRNPPLEIDWTPHYSYIPSVPSTITRLSESAGQILRNLEEVQLRTITEGLDKSLKAVTQAVDDMNMKRLGTQTEKLLLEIRETNQRVAHFLDRTRIEPILANLSATATTARRIVENAEKPVAQTLADLPESSEKIKNLAKKLDTLSEDLPETVALLRRTLRRLDNLVTNQQLEIGATVENVRQITANLKELTDNAKKYPAHVLFGAPPPHSDAENSQ